MTDESCSASKGVKVHPFFSDASLAAVADLAALQTKLQAFDGLTARPEQHPVAVGVAAELLHGRLLDGRAAPGAGVAAGGAEGVEAGGAGLQQAQEERRALAGQAR